jgi:hypothetical protein
MRSPVSCAASSEAPDLSHASQSSEADLSSEEDTRDTIYLNRHLPYEISEQQHSVQVYVNDTVGSSLDASGLKRCYAR